MIRNSLGRLAAASALTIGALTADALAAEKPEHFDIGITTFLSGPASVFGEPGRAAAEMLIEDINEEGGIGGVHVRANFIDEGAGGEALVSEYRRMVSEDGVQAMLSAISSGNCNTIAPLAEDLKVLNIMWDCGTQRIFEEGDYRYVFRTQANATPEMLATLLYLLEQKPDFQSIAVVNQDYAWGHDSWNIFKTALEALKPGVDVVAELFPKFGAPDYSTEISRLQALRPDVILSTSWGGDLDTFVRQAAQRGLTNTSTLVLPLAESSLQRLGKSLPEGVIAGGRGDHYFLHPDRIDEPEFKAFMEEFKEKTGAYPIYPVFHMSQALAALKKAYETAIEANGGEWPDTEQVVDAMEGLSFQGLGREVSIREDHQGLEAQLLGTTKYVDEYDFPVLDDIAIYAAEPITTPVGQESLAWIRSLTPETLSVKPDMYKHGE